VWSANCDASSSLPLSPMGASSTLAQLWSSSRPHCPCRPMPDSSRLSELSWSSDPTDFHRLSESGWGSDETDLLLGTRRWARLKISSFTSPVAGRGTVFERGNCRRGSGRVGTGGETEGGRGDLAGETRGEDDAGGEDEGGSGHEYS
jgi:hypothetical protein